MADLTRIELLGLPCSGKSHLAARLAEGSFRARVALAEKRKRPGRIFKVAGAALRRPDLLSVFSTLRDVRAGHLIPQFRAGLRFLSRYGEMAGALRDGTAVVLVDEGVVQATWGLFLLPCLDRRELVPRRRLDRFSARFWPSKEAGFAVLYLDTPREELLRRAASRAANHPFTKAQLAGDKAVESLGLRLMETVLRRASDAGLLTSEDAVRGVLS